MRLFCLSADLHYFCSVKSENMKKMQWFIPVILGVACLAGCGKKKTLKDVTDTEMRSAYQLTEDRKSGVIKMDSSSRQGDVQLNGINYRYVIKRMPDESLPKATDDDGNSYVDNRIELDIFSGNRKFFSRVFLKSNFSGMVDSSFVKKGILEGLVFDKVKDGKMDFSVSISYPQTDMYQSLMIEISENGGMAVKKDESMDGSDVE